jgi:hypothetical protein
VLDVPFAMRAAAMAGGARWEAEHGAFVHRGGALPDALAPFVPAPYSWELKVEREINGDPPPAPCPPRASIAPRPHQLDAVRAISAAAAAGRSGFLLADDVGLGKTITAWEAVRSLPWAQSILIVCPLAVVAHWRRTVQAMGDGGLSITLLNYERVGKLFEVSPEARAKIRSKKGLARAGSAATFDVVIWDESHRCKNPAAARSKLAAKLNARARLVLWLSATAGQNPLELSYLAPLLANVTGSRAADLKDFEQWCIQQGLGVTRGAYGKWSWRGDPADCERVRALLFFEGAPPAGIRRRPEDIAGWPEVNRILAPIDLDPEARALYERAWTEFRRELALAPSGRDPRSALAANLRLRQKGSLLRAPGTVELIRELLDNGHQVAVSVAFLETLEAMRAALEEGSVPCALIHGALPAAAREEERLRFQRGEAKVVLFTVEEGISLHQGEHNQAPRSEIIHDLRWSAIQMVQIEGRCHRDGRFAQVYWAYADGTLEEQIALVVVRRIQSMKGSATTWRRSGRSPSCSRARPRSRVTPRRSGSSRERGRAIFTPSSRARVELVEEAREREHRCARHHRQGTRAQARAAREAPGSRCDDDPRSEQRERPEDGHGREHAHVQARDRVEPERDEDQAGVRADPQEHARADDQELRVGAGRVRRGDQRDGGQRAQRDDEAHTGERPVRHGARVVGALVDASVAPCGGAEAHEGGVEDGEERKERGDHASSPRRGASGPSRARSAGASARRTPTSACMTLRTGRSSRAPSSTATAWSGQLRRAALVRVSPGWARSAERTPSWRASGSRMRAWWKIQAPSGAR